MLSAAGEIEPQDALRSSVVCKCWSCTTSEHEYNIIYKTSIQDKIAILIAKTKQK
jgi:hypothetical protein